MNNNTLLDVENHKESEEQAIEFEKAEFTRLLEVSKLDIEPAKLKIKAFCDMAKFSHGPLRQSGYRISVLPSQVIAVAEEMLLSPRLSRLDVRVPALIRCRRQDLVRNIVPCLALPPTLWHRPEVPS